MQHEIEIQPLHGSTVRVMSVLEAAAESSVALRLSDFSRLLGIPKTTLLPILQTLVELRYLKRQGDGYLVGNGLLALSCAAQSTGRDSLELVSEELSVLASRFGETAYFGVLDAGQVLYLAKADSPNPLRMLTSIGSRLPAYATGIGKALLLDKSEAELRALYPAGLSPITENTVCDIGVLAAALSRGRDVGYAEECEESTPFIRCLAVPIRLSGSIIAAISIAIPVFRYDAEMREQILRALFDSSDRIEKLLRPYSNEYKAN